MSAPGEWWCEAYGPPADGVPVESWPRCFLSADPAARSCASAQACGEQVAAERVRVHGAIHDAAADGDPIAAYLAEAFPTPDGILSGEEPPDGP